MYFSCLLVGVFLLYPFVAPFPLKEPFELLKIVCCFFYLDFSRFNECNFLLIFILTGIVLLLVYCIMSCTTQRRRLEFGCTYYDRVEGGGVKWARMMMTGRSMKLQIYHDLKYIIESSLLHSLQNTHT